MSLDTLIPAIAELLQVPPARRPAIALEDRPTGGNNRVYVVSVDGRKALAKHYFRHPSDPRDRLQAERAFLEYARQGGIDCVPGVIAGNAAHGLGIYEYVEGTRLSESEISRERVREAAAFFLRINDAAHRDAAKKLPDASEACFTVDRHLAMVDQRIARLTGISGTSEIDRDASAFVACLTELWGGVKERVLRGMRQHPSAQIEERCVSPSDFGFHNALARRSGSLCFLDFEYAGWDDPAKMVGDFFSHPALPVPLEFFDEFAAATMAYSRHAKALEARARLLRPVFQTKWCAIILNDFIPDFAARRRFADPGFDEVAAKRRQLEKARRLFASIGD